MMKSQIVFLVLAILFAIVIISNTVRKKIFERDSLLWLLLMMVVLIFGMVPNLIIVVSGLLGIDYPPSLLFLLSILALLYLVFRQTIKISNLNSRIKELGQQFALLSEEVASLREKQIK